MARRKSEITDESIRSFPTPPPRADGSTAQVFVRDATMPGFAVRITSGGARSFVVEYRTRSGRNRRVTLGAYGRLTVEKARREARKLLAQRDEGRDPAVERKIGRVALTVAEVCALYVEYLRAKRKPRSAVEVARLIANRIVPHLGSIKAETLTRADVAAWHVRLGESGRVSANRALTVLGAALSRAAKLERIRLPSGNPARGVERFAERGKERFLTVEELGRLGAALDAAEGVEHPSPLLAVRLLLLTGCRRSEIVGLRWSEVDFERGVLRLGDSKTGKKEVLLPTLAIELLRGATRLADSPFVIWGDRWRTGRRRKPGDPEPAPQPFQGLGRSWERIRQAAGLPGLRLHDLRHSWATFAVEGGTPLYLVGKALGHRDTETTQRYAHAADHPLRRAAETTAATVAAALKGEN